MTATKTLASPPFRSAEARDRYLAFYDSRAASWPVASEARMVTTDMGQTLVRISGPEGATPLVLLPGAWGHSLDWAPSMIDAFSVSFRTYSLDSISDFGRSVSSRPVKSAADFCAWLDGVLDGLGLTAGVNMLGCSRGGWISAEYVLHAPQRLAKVIWLSPGLTVINPSLTSIAGAPLSLAAVFAPSRSTVGAMMRWLMSDAASEPEFVRYVDGVVLGLQSFHPAWAGSTLGPRVLSDDELRSIETPVLYIAGEREKLSSVSAAAKRLSKVAPRVEVAVFPGAGHDLLSVQPQAVSQKVLEFLKG